MKSNLQQLTLVVGLGLATLSIANLTSGAAYGQTATSAGRSAQKRDTSKSNSRQVELHRLPDQAQSVLPAVSRELLIHTIAEKMAVAAMQHADGDVEEASERLEAVRVLLNALEIDPELVADFHPRTSDEAKNGAYAIGYLIHEEGTGTRVASELERRYGKKEMAMFEFTIKAFLAVRLYVPNADESGQWSKSALVAMERAGEVVGIPESLYTDFAKAINGGTVSNKEMLNLYVSCMGKLKDSLRFAIEAS